MVLCLAINTTNKYHNVIARMWRENGKVLPRLSQIKNDYVCKVVSGHIITDITI